MYRYNAGGLMTSNAEVLQRSSLSTIGDILCHRRLSLFGHVARLDPGIPAHDALHLMMDTYEGRKPTATWRRPPGCPRNVRRMSMLYCYPSIHAVGMWDCPGGLSGATVYSDHTMMMTVKQVIRYIAQSTKTRPLLCCLWCSLCVSNFIAVRTEMAIKTLHIWSKKRF